ncbi:MAG TPA: LysR substrate-binding domain-containing protein [Terracidiphilus sp.]|nr:LysR substrate-binding domain-containing protein [Terracidiphilus sp.]
MASLENFRLVVFRTVAEQCSFRKAAEELYLTQPAVSLQIKALEEDLGVQLFDRTGSRIALTDAGATLLGYARQVNSLLTEAEQRVASLSGDHAGHLALGASTTIAQYVLPRLLGDFRREHPRVQPTLISGNTEQIVSAIVQQQIAVGLIEGPAHSRDVKTEPFLADELVLIVPSAHEWAERGSVACQELTTIPLLMRERGSGTRRIIELAFEHHHIKRASLQIAMELDSTEAIKSAVEAGLGAGFVSRWAIAKDLRVGRSFNIVEIEGVRLRRDFLIAYASGPGLQGLAEEFRRFLVARPGASGTTPLKLK